MLQCRDGRLEGELLEDGRSQFPCCDSQLCEMVLALIKLQLPNLHRGAEPDSRSILLPLSFQYKILASVFYQVLTGDQVIS